MNRFLMLPIVLIASALVLTGTRQLTGVANAQATQPAQQPDQILHRLLQHAPPVTPPTVPGTRSEPASVSPTLVRPAPTGPAAKLLPEGYYISDRRGRLVKQAGHWEFAFEADVSGRIDPPIRLLPNRWLEKMEADSAAATRSMAFRVSGEVTEYHGKNYLLVRKVLIEQDFSKTLTR